MTSDPTSASAPVRQGRPPRRRVADRLPDFPWDTIAGAKATAAAHPGGICDLSVGTPVDPTPDLARRALLAAADAHGYPTTVGTAELRDAMVAYMAGRWGAVGLDRDGVLPVIGTKELVAWLPTQLGLGSEDTIVVPATAYPTYEVGARIVGARVVAATDLASLRAELGDVRPSLVWINSPSNPTGEILDAATTKAWVDWAREVGAVLASDECYGEFGWDAEPWSVLHPDICGEDHRGLLSCMSLSKRSNLAGYRAGFVAGDPELVAELLELRKHGGMMMPGPVQAAMAALLVDQEHVEEQRQRYLARRAVLRPALEAAGFRIDHSEGSLYLWATRDEDSRTTLDRLAERGILAAPGDFYGAAGARHVRIALTATDERIAEAARRLTA
ncbi:succinyldiaminopimelate transaminase [Raineyella antarctica]|uniref:Aminotransferase n=1 Tax=Raineyella antarctica TaxID=1577474 RepID=A0A1G6GDR1_9ACTN|nr:succinyldiaminopimelate transaminase [Raineyella antarctica]SDB80049.1 succinyldiaminopimelate transaminase [Raineyella antarctica]